MVDALAEEKLDGFCAGEPWHARSRRRVTRAAPVALTSEIWPNHPEKVLASRRDFAALHPNTARAHVRTMLEACRWLDSPAHRAEISGQLAAPELLGVPRSLIEPRLSGVYDMARLARPPLPVSFFDGGAVNYPRGVGRLWFLTQYRRWGLYGGGAGGIGGDAAIAASICQTALYREAAALADVPVPAESRADVLCDGRVWDGSDPAAYLEGFTVRACEPRPRPASVAKRSTIDRRIPTRAAQGGLYGTVHGSGRKARRYQFHPRTDAFHQVRRGPARGDLRHRAGHPVRHRLCEASGKRLVRASGNDGA